MRREQSLPRCSSLFYFRVIRGNTDVRCSEAVARVVGAQGRHRARSGSALLLLLADAARNRLLWSTAMQQEKRTFMQNAAKSQTPMSELRTKLPLVVPDMNDCLADKAAFRTDQLN